MTLLLEPENLQRPYLTWGLEAELEKYELYLFLVLFSIRVFAVQKKMFLLFVSIPELLNRGLF